MRPEATGYGCVYFAIEILKHRHSGVEGKKVAISGSGNVAQHAAAKVIEMGGKVVSLSDSGGTASFPDGLDEAMLEAVTEWKNVRRGRLADFAKEHRATFIEGRKPWALPCEIALPCATQNEIDATDAARLVRNGCICVAEGANMPSTNEAVGVFQAARIAFAPGKAANAGGVATSALEMSQNATHLPWTHADVDTRLHAIMKSIHHVCIEHGTDSDGRVDYVRGANVGGFVKVADAMLAQGVV
jgi:glutamate dehydrogenase (NADP+)